MPIQKAGFKNAHLLFCFLKHNLSALACVAQLAGALSHNRKVVGSIVSKGTYLGCGSYPCLGAYRKQPMMLPSHTDVFLSPFLSLKVIFKNVLG